MPTLEELLARLQSDEPQSEPQAPVAPDFGDKDKNDLYAMSQDNNTAKLLGLASNNSAPEQEDPKLAQLGGDMDKYTKLIQSLKAASPQPQSDSPTDTQEPAPSPETDTVPNQKTTSDQPGYDKAALEAALNKKNTMGFLADLADAGNTMGAGITNTKADPHLFDNARASGNRDLEKVTALQKASDEDVQRQIAKLHLVSEKEKSDPNSEVSKLYRTALKSLGMQVSETASAASMEKAFPAVEKAAAMLQASEDRKLRYAQLNADKADKADAKSSSDTEKQTVKFNEALDPTKGRAGNFGKAYESYIQADKLKALANKASSGLNLTPAETEEFALGYGRLISGSGGASRAQIEALVPHSAQGDMNKTLQWITNNPRGTDQQAFIQRMLDGVNRQQTIAKNQLDTTKAQRAQAFESLHKKDPTGFERGLESSGLSLDDYKEFLKNKKIPDHTEKTDNSFDDLGFKAH